jgi:hypothetical protein
MKKRLCGNLIVFLAILFSGCQSWQEEPVFQKLVGVWETDFEIYEDCTVEITSEELIFSRDPDYTEHFQITEMETTPSKSGPLIVLSLENTEGAGLKQRFHLIEKKGKLILRTLPPESHDWIKRKEAL